jgi:zinc/manganese transport system substrate-binding protein
VAFSATDANAQLKVFACVPEWASLAQSIGGDKVEITLATSALENPDSIRPTPALIAALQAADLLVCTGAGLSEGIDEMLDRAQNPKVAPGQPGHFEAADYVELLEVPHMPMATQQAEEEEEEMHPHIQGDPRNVQKVAAQLSKRMAQLDPDNADAYNSAAKTFIGDLGKLAKELLVKAEPLKGVNVAVQHPHSHYLLRWLGINNPPTAIVEPEPNVPPGPAHLESVVKAITDNNIKFIVYAAYEDPSPSKYVAEKSGIPMVKLPFTVGGTEEAKDFFGFFQDSVQRLLDGLSGHERS